MKPQHQECVMKANKLLLLVLFLFSVSLRAQTAKEFMQTGSAHLENKKYKSAHAAFVKAQRMSPGNYDAFFLDGMALYQLGYQNKALKMFKKAKDIDTGPAAVHFMIGQCYLKKRARKKAIMYYDVAIAKDTSKSSYYHYRGLALYRKKKYDEAKKSFYSATIKRSPVRESFLFLGLCDNKKKRYSVAIDDFTVCLDKFPDYGLAYYNRAILKIKIDEEVGACADLEESLKYNYQRAAKKLKKYCR